MRSLLIAVFGASLLLTPAFMSGARGQPNNRPATELEFEELAKSIAKMLRGRDADSVSLGAFKNKRDPQISHGPGMCQHLKRELACLDVKVDGKARYVVEGEYIDNIDKKSQRVFIELTCRMLDRKMGNAVLAGFSPRRGLFGEQALIEFLTPAAVILDPGATPQQAEASFVAQNDSDKPLVHVHGNKVFASDKREYGVEILVKKGAGYAARKPELKDGHIYVTVRRDEAFAVRLVNGSEHEAAATIHIDGLNVFSFSDLVREGNAAPRWMVATRKETTVTGWPIRSGLAHEFLVTEYAKSAVAELNAAGSHVGVITVTFSAAWPKRGQAPRDEKAGARSADAVGRGAPLDAPFQVVPMRFGVTRAIFNIRYQRPADFP
jgi:hypothetical protein